MQLGYDGVQMGTRFIATRECTAHDDYKQALVRASERDVVLSERITGVPVSILRTPAVDKMGARAGPLAKWLLRGSTTRHWMRTYYTIRSAWQLKDASMRGMSSKDFWQAAKSVETVCSVEPAGDIVRRFADALRAAATAETTERA